MSQNKPTALITGANRGIGHAIAQELSSTHRLVLGTRTEEKWGALRNEFPDAIPFVADLTDEAVVAQAIATAQIDSLDVLIHSAGQVQTGSIAQADKREWNALFDINVFSVVNLTSQLLAPLRRSNGQIVFINSGSGFVSKPENGLYSATKFALRAVADALREEERGTVRVSSVHPGKVDTDMQRELQSAQGNSPQEYDPDVYVKTSSIATAVRTVVDMSPEATVEEILVRPVIK